MSLTEGIYCGMHAWLAESRCCATDGMRRSMISWYLAANMVIFSSKHGDWMVELMKDVKFQWGPW